MKKEKSLTKEEKKFCYNVMYMVITGILVIAAISAYNSTQKHNVTLEAVCTFEGENYAKDITGIKWNYNDHQIYSEGPSQLGLDSGSCRITAIIPTTADPLKQVEDVIANPELKRNLALVVNEELIH